jgi:hypothetical protein
MAALHVGRSSRDLRDELNFDARAEWNLRHAESTSRVHARTPEDLLQQF